MKRHFLFNAGHKVPVAMGTPGYINFLLKVRKSFAVSFHLFLSLRIVPSVNFLFSGSKMKAG